jgi:hypothetical protein
MKTRNRHTEPKTLTSKAKKKPTPRTMTEPPKVRTLHGIPLTAPIFNTPLAGKHSIYIRPYDPVWPLEEEQKN